MLQYDQLCKLPVLCNIYLAQWFLCHKNNKCISSIILHSYNNPEETFSKKTLSNKQLAFEKFKRWRYYLCLCMSNLGYVQQYPFICTINNTFTPILIQEHVCMNIYRQLFPESSPIGSLSYPMTALEAWNSLNHDTNNNTHKSKTKVFSNCDFI